MKRALVILAGLSLFAFTPMVYAQAPTFADFDANQDGQLTLEEIQAVIPDFTQDDFNAADTDQNGTLSPDEFDALGMQDAPAN